MTNDFLDAAERVGDLEDDLHDGIGDAVDSGMGETEAELKQAITREGSVASGELRRETQKTPLPEDSPDTITNVGIRSTDYWEYVEHGTGLRGDSGIPSPDIAADPKPIQEWIEDKGISGKRYNEDPVGDDDVSSLAWAIAFRIGSSGTYPHPFVRPTWYASPNGHRNLIDGAEDAMSKAVRRF